jgi:hypothetical protein
MSENELIPREEEDGENDSIIAICEADAVDEVRAEERLKKIFVSSG